MKQFGIVASLILTGMICRISAQVAIPYHNNFDTPSDSSGWTHYAITGTDDWELGVPAYGYYTAAYSAPNAWVTNLDNVYALHSERVLETPVFDLSDTSSNFSLSFYHKRHYSSIGNYFYMQYSIDNGSTWLLLDDATAQKKNWQTGSGFASNWYNSFQNSVISLNFLEGEDSVKFRFRFISGSYTNDGWMIDNFSISEEYFNIFANQGDSVFVSQHCADFEVTSVLGFSNQYSTTVYNTTNYYFSYDDVLDSTDTLIATKSAGIYSTIATWSTTIDMLPDLHHGYYYIIYVHDALDTLHENDESDNSGYVVFCVDSVYDVPYVDDFENANNDWETVLDPGSDMLVWQLGRGYKHHLEQSHSGTWAWHTCKSNEYYNSNCGTSCNIQYLVFPYIDVSQVSGTAVFNLWYKSETGGNGYTIQYSDNCSESWNNLYSFPICRNDEWDFVNVNLNSISSLNNLRFRIKYSISYLKQEGIIIDDVYVGSAKPDLSIERDLSDRYTLESVNSDTLIYFLNNSGLATASQSVTAFYWSNDSILDGNDILLGTKQEQSLGDTVRIWSSFAYSKPTTIPGSYYIVYLLDTANTVDEMREYNNTGYFTIFQESDVSFPYFNDFESQIDGWRHNASLGRDDWQWTMPHGDVLNSAFSGDKVWITNDTGLVSPMSRMHLYTPVFDFSTSINPVLEFDMKLHSDESCHCFEGKMNMSYSIDGGATWVVLDRTNQSYNRWYYPMEYEAYGGIDRVYMYANYSEILFATSEYSFAAYSQYNSRDSERNTRYVLDVAFLAGNPNVRFRYNLGTLTNDSQSANYAVEGAMIDNFSISERTIDLNVNYRKKLLISPLAQSIKFYMNIKNQGNYITLPSIVKYYISADTLLDGSDFYLGQENIPAVRPDMSYYVNEILDAPADLSNYQYLIYSLDDTNTNTESNESNNVGYWPLESGGISTYPYYNDFNDTIIDGWNHYVISYAGEHLTTQYRFRNMVAPGEPLYQSGIKSAEMFTDRINGTMNIGQVPFWYLETPAFNFGATDSIFLSFDLMCSGRKSTRYDGGNLEFSTDGGNTWAILSTAYGQAFHWYNYTQLSDLNNEPGWSGQDVALDSTSFNASFLRGKENVVFRFKYRSNWEYSGGGTPQGMRIDNFRIAGYTIDYIANDIMVPISANLAQPVIQIDYSISNSGQINGRVTSTKFFWSTDSILDDNDLLVKTIVEGGINIGATLSNSTTITYPTPITQSVYYLHYLTDADSSLAETNEVNNVGSYRVFFQSFPNYYPGDEGDTIITNTTQPTLSVTYSIINNGFEDGVNSTTAFYWSADSVFDIGDQIIQTVSEPLITIGDTLISEVDIAYPTPITQPLYYLYYRADDFNDMIETNETDNIGGFKIIFDDITALPGLSLLDQMNIYVNENYLFIQSPIGFPDQSCHIRLINESGQILLNSEIIISSGLNKLELPLEDLPCGIYLLYLQNSEGIVTRKIIIS
ncbi:MAG: hypothetical protein KKA07_16925 [Bacteroidetes bacterium]|nr:hypothetical protein [Bacteroidota bacterium]